MKIRVAKGIGVLVVVAAAIGAGALAYAAIPDGSGVIHGCYANRDGSLRVIDPSAGGTCDSRKETALDWSQTGPQGPPGPSAGFYATKRDQVHLLPGGADTTVVSIAQLPAGSYLLMGHTAAVNYNGSQQGYVRCGIKAAGQDSFGPLNFPGSATSLAPEPSDTWAVGQVAASLAVTSSAPFSAEFFCRQNRIDTAYVEETRLMAIALGSVTTSGDA
jgi:hypothetical protein